MSARVLVTGATGFVGAEACAALAHRGYIVRAAVRGSQRLRDSIAEQAIVGDIGATTDWEAALRDVDFVLHLAARVHILGDDAANADLYMEVNERGTKRLAQMAARAGVRRLVHLSSIKVNGEGRPGAPYTAEEPPDPQDAYGRSKAAAEAALQSIATATGMQIASVRSPLVYGPGVRANFLRLMTWVERGWPVPLGSVRNARSLVSVWNLSDLLVQAIEHPAAAGGIWMVSDGVDLSTPELIERIGRAMGRPARLWPVPMAALYFAATLLGRKAEVTRLCGSLTVDISRTRAELEWNPPVTIDEALDRTVEWYLRAGQAR